MNFENARTLWTENRLTQAGAAHMLGVCEPTFRRYLLRYQDILMISLKHTVTMVTSNPWKTSFSSTTGAPRWTQAWAVVWVAVAWRICSPRRRLIRTVRHLGFSRER